MKRTSCLALFSLAAALLPAATQAQSYASAPPPLYPYELQPGQPYAVEVAPNTYVIHRGHNRRDFPYVRCVRDCADKHDLQAQPAPKFDRPIRHNDRALIEELRRRSAKAASKNAKPADMHTTTKIVREKPIVIERRRVVNDPPRVIVRRHYVEDAPAKEPLLKPGKKGEPRVIRAEAEVTILGPDRMSIRLFRKGGANAKAEADDKN